jgi:hypothetical protein
LSVDFIGWKSRAFVSLCLSTVDSSRESTFGRPSCGEKKPNNPGESRMPDNRNNLSRSPQRILAHEKVHYGALRAFLVISPNLSTECETDGISRLYVMNYRLMSLDANM